MTEKPLWDWLRCNATAAGLVGHSDLIPPEAMQVFESAMGRYIMDDAHGFWLEPESQDGHCDPIALVKTLALRVDALYNAYNGRVTQSPIEDRMLAALLWLNCDWAGFPDFDYLDGPQDHLRDYGVSKDLGFMVTPQAKVAGHKVDFLVWFMLGRHVGGVAIECDGHDFHEKTKEQAARDKKRDREILTAGFPVMRFAGSEVYRDALACAEQLLGPLNDALLRVSRDGGLFNGPKVETDTNL